MFCNTIKLFLVVNVDTFFLSHRREIALSAMREGYDVTIIAKDTGCGRQIQELGLNFVNLPINKTGLNIFEELKTFNFLYKLIAKERPDIVHLVGMKSILWGGLAARMLKVKGIVSAVSGLGVLFASEHNKGIKNLISKAVLKVMRYIHNRHNAYCIFHNKEDMDMFIRCGIVDMSQCFKTMGSGIDLQLFKYTEESSSEKIRILFTARMVEDKGVVTLVDAADLLRPEYENKVTFLLCGGLETNPTAISEEWLLSHCDSNYIKWLGHREDVRELLESSHIFAFPSYYKEGLPKSCIEAAAIGRPIITCDSRGCRDTVIQGETGFLVPIKDSNAFAEKLRVLIDDKQLRIQMGKKARMYAESVFSIERVVDIHLNLYKRII